jgi:hypothetical protein
MPDKLWREIDEIVRNAGMDRTDRGQSLGDRIRAFNRPASRTRVVRPRFQLRLSGASGLLLLGVFLALIGAGARYYLGPPPIPALYSNLVGVVGVAAFLSILLGLVIGWRERFGRRAAPSWRGQPSGAPGRTFRPFAPIATQWRIMRLKYRYWRTRGR